MVRVGKGGMCLEELNAGLQQTLNERVFLLYAVENVWQNSLNAENLDTRPYKQAIIQPAGSWHHRLPKHCLKVSVQKCLYLKRSEECTGEGGLHLRFCRILTIKKCITGGSL
jgi:hypothetical protein